MTTQQIWIWADLQFSGSQSPRTFFARERSSRRCQITTTWTVWYERGGSLLFKHPTFRESLSKNLTSTTESSVPALQSKPSRSTSDKKRQRSFCRPQGNKLSSAKSTVLVRRDRNITLADTMIRMIRRVRSIWIRRKPTSYRLRTWSLGIRIRIKRIMMDPKASSKFRHQSRRR